MNFAYPCFFLLFFNLSWVGSCGGGGVFKETILFKRRGLVNIPAAPSKGLGHEAVKRGHNSTVQYTRPISSV